MRFYLPTIVTALLLTLVHSTDAQSLLGLQYPFGYPLRTGSGSALSLAGTGVAIGNDFYGMSSNPANLGVSGRTTFASVISSDLLMLRDASVGSNHLDMNLRLFSLTVPLGRFGAIGASFEPYSTSNARFRLYQPVTIDKMLADTMELGIISSGGALCWQAGWGYTVNKLFRIGLAYKRFNFSQSLSSITMMRGSLNDRLVDSTRISFATNAFRGGLQIPFRAFTAGITGEYFFSGEATGRSIISGTRDTVEMRSNATYSLKPPPSIAFGLSWRLNPRWFTACDGGVTLWERYYSELGSATGALRDAWFVSGGVQYIPAPDLLTPKIYEIIQYRAGARYTQLPQTGGAEISGTIAAGFPMQANGGLFDIILEVSRRYDDRFEGYRENMIGIRLGINGARKWYQSSDESY